ncbi:hypothetical protein [Megalodesulfovibrio paquesii]
MRIETAPLRPVPLFLGALVMAATLFWAGWKYSENIARISQGAEGAPQAQQEGVSKIWSDTLACATMPAPRF